METFDLCMFTPRSVRWRRASASISGGTPVAGSPRLAMTDGGGFWVCEMSDVWIRTAEALKAALALEARLDEGATSILVPYRDTHLGPGTQSYAVVATMADPAALRATSLNVALTVGTPLVGGEHFSIDHATKGRRLYRVASATALTGGEQTLTIRPPLREAVTNEALDFNAPSCEMRLTNPGDFLGAIESGRFSSLNATFAEAF